jgi:hypothetical protein
MEISADLDTLPDGRSACSSSVTQLASGKIERQNCRRIQNSVCALSGGHCCTQCRAVRTWAPPSTLEKIAEDSALGSDEQAVEYEKGLNVDEHNTADNDKVVLDKHGRIAGTSNCGLSFEFSTNNIKNVHTKTIIHALARDAKKLFHAKHQTYFWISAGSKPRSGLEALAMKIFKHHTKNVKKLDLEKSGAEWWIQVRNGGLSASRAKAGDQIGSSFPGLEDVGFHWDKDENLMEQRGTVVGPALSTVTCTFEQRGSRSL